MEMFTMKRASRFRRAFALTVLAVAPLATGPAWSDTVNLMQAYERMVQGGIEFGIIDLSLLASAEEVRQAKGQRLPRIQLSFEYDEVNQNIVASDNTAYTTGHSQYPKLAVDFTIRQPIYDAVRFRALPLARAEDEERKARAEIARNRVVRDMIGAYLKVAEAQIAVKRAEVVLDTRKEYQESLAEEVSAGRRESDSLAKAESETLSAGEDALEAKVTLADALAELQRYTGPEVTAVSLDGSRVATIDLASLDRSMTRDAVLVHSPDLIAAQAARDVAARQIDSARGASHPSLDLVLNMEHSDTEGSLYGGGSQIETVTGGLMLTVPIYEGGIQRSKVREAEINARQAELKVKQTRGAVLAQYDALVTAVRMSAERSRTLREHLALASQNLQTAEEQYNSGRANEALMLEQRLRRDVMRLDLEKARLAQLRLQTQLYALFGALDLRAISQEAEG